MIEFTKKFYEGSVEPIIEPTFYHNIGNAKEAMKWEFDNHPDAAIYEEVKQADGRFSVAVKDRYHKIIIQLKTVNAIYEEETKN